MSHPTKKRPSRPRSSASDRVLLNTVLTLLGDNLLRILTQRPRAWAPFPLPANTINWTTLFGKCRALAQTDVRPPRGNYARKKRNIFRWSALSRLAKFPPPGKLTFWRIFTIKPFINPTLRRPAAKQQTLLDIEPLTGRELAYGLE